MGDKSEEEKAKEAENNIEIWKIKKLIKSLEMARGYAPSWQQLQLLRHLLRTACNACSMRSCCRRAASGAAHDRHPLPADASVWRLPFAATARA